MYLLNVNSLASYVMMTLWYVLTMVFLIDRNLYTKAKAIHHTALAFLFVWWILALIFHSLAAKLYGALLIMAVVVIEIRIRKRRAQELASLHQHG
jgi:uncharacterized integral membrane protein